MKREGILSAEELKELEGTGTVTYNYVSVGASVIIYDLFREDGESIASGNETS